MKLLDIVEVKVDGVFRKFIFTGWKMDNERLEITLTAWKSIDTAVCKEGEQLRINAPKVDSSG